MFSNTPFKKSFEGVSQKQTMHSSVGSENVMVRKILRDSWNKYNLQASINGRGRVIDSFRAANNLGDYLGRQHYICGNIPTPNIPRRRPGWTFRNAQSNCDGTGIQGSSCNPRYVSDCSDYILFKKQGAILGKYNSIST